jgi:hypothetical protein
MYVSGLDTGTVSDTVLPMTATRSVLLILAGVVLVALSWFAAIGIELCIAAPTVGDCSKVDLSHAVDINQDGLIDCGSDIELGA